MSGISGLSQLTTGVTSLANLILVTPQVKGYQPLNPPTKTGQSQSLPKSILFHYEGQNSVRLKSDITDHWVEDNTAIQNQISLRPPQISTHGFIGELNDVFPLIPQSLKTAASKLSVLGAYQPNLSLTALQALQQAEFLYNVGLNAASAAVDTIATLTGGNQGTVIDGAGIVGGFNANKLQNTSLTATANQTKQQIFFALFYGYWSQRTLFNVQTPWAVFNNCAIEEVAAVQGEETDMITDFQVTFKPIRFASDITTKEVGIADGRAAIQSSSITNLGNSTPPTSATSLAGAISGVA